jgi:hypothetical protein
VPKNLTRSIVKGDHNKEYMVPVEEILTWYPADFIRECYKCPQDRMWHTCISTKLQWEYVLDIDRSDERYYDIYKSIRRIGFAAPVRAKISEDDHVILLDGHNRVGVAWDMSLREIPVYVATRETVPDDLIAADSGIWQKQHKPWIDILGR